MTERKKINLPIGGIVVVREPAEVATVLGSCVSVCLFDPGRGIAGMNHYMLPRPHDGRAPSVGRFGQTSIPELLSRMIKQGASVSRITAKLFGGASMLEKFSKFSGISKGNVKVAQEFFREQGIKIVAQDVGGNRGRKIVFHTDTGRVFVRQVGTKECL